MVLYLNQNQIFCWSEEASQTACAPLELLHQLLLGCASTTKNGDSE